MVDLDPPRLCNATVRSEDLPIQIFSARSGRFGTADQGDLRDMSRRGAIGLSPTAIGVRFGYRRVRVLLQRKEWPIYQKKTSRIYKELGMQFRNKIPKRRVKAKLRDDRQAAAGPNEVWAMDFASTR